MKIKIFVSVLIVAVVGIIFLLKSNDNGGSVMADTQKTNSNNTHETNSSLGLILLSIFENESLKLKPIPYSNIKNGMPITSIAII